MDRTLEETNAIEHIREADGSAWNKVGEFLATSTDAVKTIVDQNAIVAPTPDFRVKMSLHLAGLVKKSPAVAKQFLPQKEEALDFGTKSPFEEGRLNHGIYGLERVYADRAVITPYFDCAAYCRYCFKKTRTLAGEGERRMSEADIEAAATFIERDPRINTVLITGGDPFEDPELLGQVLDRVIRIPHVTNYRIGTRNILFKPRVITDALAEKLAAYNRINYENLKGSKNVSIGFSLNHPDEISPDVARAVERLTKRGLVVRGQTVLLKGINDRPETILELMQLFGVLGIVPYYFLHCMPVVGSRHFRTSVQKGLDILRTISPFTGACAPLYVYVTEVGKHRLMPGMPLDYVTEDGARYIRATTPYRATDFLRYTGKNALAARHSVDEAGFIVSHYLDGEDA